MKTIFFARPSKRIQLAHYPRTRSRMASVTGTMPETKKILPLESFALTKV